MAGYQQGIPDFQQYRQHTLQETFTFFAQCGPARFKQQFIVDRNNLDIAVFLKIEVLVGLIPNHILDRLQIAAIHGPRLEL